VKKAIAERRRREGDVGVNVPMGSGGCGAKRWESDLTFGFKALQKIAIGKSGREKIRTLSVGPINPSHARKLVAISHILTRIITRGKGCEPRKKRSAKKGRGGGGG